MRENAHSTIRVRVARLFILPSYCEPANFANQRELRWRGYRGKSNRIGAPQTYLHILSLHSEPNLETLFRTRAVVKVE